MCSVVGNNCVTQKRSFMMHIVSWIVTNLLLNLRFGDANDQSLISEFLDQAIDEFHIDAVVLQTEELEHPTQIKVLYSQRACGGSMEAVLGTTSTAVIVMPDCQVNCTQLEAAQKNKKWFILAPSPEQLLGCN